MNVMDLMPLFGTITDYVENVSRPLKEKPAAKLFEKKRTISEKQKLQREKFHRAANFARYQLRDEKVRNYFTEKAKREGLSNAYVAAVTDYLRLHN